jgi:hypothetical protein
VIGHRHGEVDGGVGEVAAGLRETGGLFSQAGGVGERADGDCDAGAGSAAGLLDPPVRAALARVGFGRPAAQLLGPGHVRAVGREYCADRQGERIARVIGRAGQLEGRFVG